MTFKALRSPDRWTGLLAIFVLAALDIVLIERIVGREVDGISFLLALIVLASPLVIFYIGYRTIGTFTLEYWISRDAVTLVWGATRQIVPITTIERVLKGPEIHAAAGPSPWHWPCPERRRLTSPEVGVVNSYATRPLAEQIVLVTPGESYGLSPVDAQGFLTALQQRYAFGAARVVEPELQRPPVWTWPLWRDRTALILMGAGLLGVLLMFGYLCFQFPFLSSDLPLHFDMSGLPDRIAPKAELFGIAIIGLVTWLFNTATGVWLYRHVQQGAAYLLWGGAMVVQAIAGLALFNLMRW
jgi:hypothetical protein